MIESNSYYSDGSLNYKSTYKRDVMGNIIENNTYNADGSLRNKYPYKYEFDTMGNWIKITKTADGLLTERVIEYY
jgi:antitoxin component YwqK of YwqJK toxin-antitoxin module